MPEYDEFALLLKEDERNYMDGIITEPFYYELPLFPNDYQHHPGYGKLNTLCK